MSRFIVPFYSQYGHLDDASWHARGCGIVSLAMVMAYWHQQSSHHQLPELEELLQQGQALGAYRPGIGWTHRGLVDVAVFYGYQGFNVDAAPQSSSPLSAAEAFDRLVVELFSGPVLASVFAGFDPARGGGHIVVVTGVEGDRVYFNDPEEKTEQTGLRSCSREDFLFAFKRRFVVVRPVDVET